MITLTDPARLWDSKEPRAVYYITQKKNWKCIEIVWPSSRNWCFEMLHRAGDFNVGCWTPYICPVQFIFWLQLCPGGEQLWVMWGGQPWRRPPSPIWEKKQCHCSKSNRCIDLFWRRCQQSFVSLIFESQAGLALLYSANFCGGLPRRYLTKVHGAHDSAASRH